MILFFSLTIIGGLIIGAFKSIYEPAKGLPLDTKHVFYNTYEENQYELRCVNRQRIFVSLLSNVAVVVLVAVLYWLCSPD